MIEELAQKIQGFVAEYDHNTLTALVVGIVLMLMTLRFRARQRRHDEEMKALRKEHFLHKQKDPDLVVDSQPSARRARLTIILSTAIMVILLFIGIFS